MFAGSVEMRPIPLRALFERNLHAAHTALTKRLRILRSFSPGAARHRICVNSHRIIRWASSDCSNSGF